jgi:hypothetical protein
MRSALSRNLVTHQRENPNRAATSVTLSPSA